MLYRTQQTVEPTSEALLIDEVKDHLRVDTSADDNYIQSLIKTARMMTENTIDKALLTQTWKFYFDGFPRCDVIEIPKAPIQSITSVEYVDTDGTTQTWASSNNWSLDTTGIMPRIILDYDQTWPDTEGSRNNVIITGVFGYTSLDAIPEPIKHAMMMLIGHWYENRENTLVNGTVLSMPFATKALLDQYKTSWAT